MVSASVAIIFAILFLAILFLLHFLKPELDPSWRMISEYEIGRHGWLMRLAFFAWGTSVLGLLFALWPLLEGISGLLSRGWLVLIVIALYGAGLFKTDPITQITTHWVNTVHTLCGAFVILTFPIAASLTVFCLRHSQVWTAGAGLLIFATVLNWIGMLAFFASSIISRRLDPTAGRVGPKVYLGWPNRFMVVMYVVWLLILAETASHL